MKSVIIDQPKEAKPEYPCLKVHDFGIGKTIALFKGDKTGVVVYSENSIRPLGQIADNFDMSAFTPFTGKLELSN